MAPPRKKLEENIRNYQTRKNMFDHISKHREESWKYDAQRSIFDELRGVWKCGQTLSWVFEISSQSKLRLRRKQRKEIVKIYANYDRISKHRHGHNFLCLNLMSLRTTNQKWCCLLSSLSFYIILNPKDDQAIILSCCTIEKLEIKQRLGNVWKSEKRLQSCY